MFSRGCHQLIRQGATLVESPEDILQELPEIIPLDRFRSNSPSVPAGKSSVNPDDARLLALIEESGPLPESLSVQTGLTQQQLMVKLLELELTGMVIQQGGRYFPA